MNFSLKNRITASFILSLLIVLCMGGMVFHYLNDLNESIQEITINLNNENSLTDEIRITIANIIKLQRKFSARSATEVDLEKLNGLSEGLQSQLSKLKSIYNDDELKDIIGNMSGYVEAFRTNLNNAENLRRINNKLAIENIETSTDKIVTFFTSIVEKQFSLTINKEKKMMSVIRETKTNMLVTLIIVALGTLLISMVIPGKIALPFRKISDAIRELQECNFDVSIYYNQKDEIGELSREINKMIRNIKKFEELRTDRISVELRKFDALANMVQKNVLVANADGELIYLNNKLYSRLNLKSDDVLNKNLQDTLLPETIKQTYELALKRRSKIENEPIEFMTKMTDEEDSEPVEKAFEGFANVIPVRGKESSLDYYLMIISKDLFA